MRPGCGSAGRGTARTGRGAGRATSGRYATWPDQGGTQGRAGRQSCPAGRSEGRSSSGAACTNPARWSARYPAPTSDSMQKSNKSFSRLVTLTISAARPAGVASAASAGPRNSAAASRITRPMSPGARCGSDCKHHPGAERMGDHVDRARRVDVRGSSPTSAASAAPVGPGPAVGAPDRAERGPAEGRWPARPADWPGAGGAAS